MDTVLFAGFALAYLALLAWGARPALRRGHLSPADLPLLVLAGLVYDNAVIAAGSLIGAGPVLETLSLGRFWIHALITPVLVAWGLHTLRRAGFPWAQTRGYQLGGTLAVLALVALELLTEVRGLRIVPGWEYGVLSYSNAAPASGPPLMVLIVALVLIVAGVLLWRRQGWPWLAAGAIAMTLGSAIPLPLPSGAVTNAFELALLLSVTATTAFQEARPRTSAGSDNTATPMPAR